MDSTRRSLLLACMAAGAVPWRLARAQASYPTKPIRLVISSAPGGSPDILARLLAPKLAEGLGQQVLVDDVPGAAGIIGTDRVAKSAPDGYTLLYGHQQVVTMNPVLHKNLPYQPERDLQPISTSLDLAYVWLATLKLPANTMSELVKLAREQPGRISYASTGPGSAAHLGGVMVERAADIKLLHVPYKGNTNSDLIAGTVQLRLESLAAAIALVKSGKVKALAVATPKRLDVLPDVPTIGETLKDCEMPGFHGFWAPMGTPPAIVARLNAEVVKVVAMPDIARRISELGFQPRGSTVDEMTQRIRAETQEWATIVKTQNIALE
jgi:tripartite-type tricarboxylate transporter receptor subunit TctC